MLTCPTSRNPTKNIFSYFERSTRTSGKTSRSIAPPKSYSLDNVPENLQKKVTLLKHFRSYLEEQSKCKRTKHMFPRKSEHGDNLHVKKWIRTRHAIFYRFTDETIQVSFFDKSEIIMNSSKRCFLYTDKRGQRSAMRYDEGRKCAEVLKRMKYARDLLGQILAKV